jgi:hypothetical protein
LNLISKVVPTLPLFLKLLAFNPLPKKRRKPPKLQLVVIKRNKP